MTTSEKIRLVIIIALILIFLARKYGWLESWRESRQKKQLEEDRKRQLAERKDQRKKARQDQETKRIQTAEVLRRGLGMLHQKTLQVAGHDLWYLDSDDGTQGTPVVLLHGFAGSKENWSNVGNRLAQQGYRVIAPDLPGFGQNERNQNLAYDVTSQAKRIRALIQQLKLERFHLVGHSMGGSIAAAISYAASQDVVSLTLIEPFGVHVPYQSELDKLLAQDRNPMVIANPAAYNNLLGFIHHAPVDLPPAVKKQLAEEAAEHRVFYLKVWKEIREGERANLLDLLLPEIKNRTLVIQGAESQVIHPSTPDIIRSMM
ncbi:MAG: alpha/beta hydrolase, partial [Acidobacteriota bacterium]